MTKINAKWNKGVWLAGDTLPMCSASERDEMFLVGEKWECTLPNGYCLFKTPAKSGDCIEVIGEKDGKEVLIGYACPVVYVLMAIVFQNYEDCYNSEFFHPSSYIQCKIEDAAKAVEQQKEMLENECYGD